MGDTQFERDRRRSGREARMRLALFEAVYAVLHRLEGDNDEDVYEQLSLALGPYNIAQARKDVEYHDREDAREKRDEDAKAAALVALEELPDAPERVQCQIDVARNQGRWTDFGRCENAAKRIVFDTKNKVERCLCLVHAKEYMLRGSSRFTEWHDLPSHESWARVKYGKRK